MRPSRVQVSNTRPSRGRRVAFVRCLAGFGALLATLFAGQASSQPAPAPAPAASASAPAASSAAAPPAPSTGFTFPTRRKKVEGPPDPTPDQLRALEILQKEADAYAADARDYRNTLDRVIRHHYEEKRRRLVTVLENEIDIETKGLKAARDEAIAELEAFIAKYSGDNAHPESTPDAMFRLAALYEEKERELSDEVEVAPGEPPPEPDLGKAIALYRRIIDEFPNYRELAGVFYYLGHAYNDMGELDQSQYVWRSLVCRNEFPYPIPEAEKGEDLARLPQDHDPDWWLGWMGRHGKPIDQMVEEDGHEPNRDDEEVFDNPYPESCQRVKQELKPGEEPRYVAEIWWRLGDFHFEEIDPYGGPFNLNRAEAAYRQSMKITKPPVFGVAMYKLAWTFYKQQRYEAAVKQFVELLRYTDEQERLTGNPGADFRAEAYAYIAGSLMYVDFEGPGPDDPYIARNDIFDIEPNPAIIEEKLHLAIDRVQDPSLVPQDKPWTIEIYKALAFEFKEYNHLHNLIELDELILAKWPMHRDAPMVQNQIAETYEALAAQTRGDEREKYQAKALEARGKLVNYVATGSRTPPWVEANKDDPEAIRAAERLVRAGLRRAAADHTNAARGWVRRARSEEGEDRDKAFRTALREYQLAGEAWSGYLLQDENAEDAYESRFWWADALTNQVLIHIALDQDPPPELVADARLRAREVRDSNEGDKYLQPAAIMVVRIAQQLVQRAYKKFDESGGSRGFAKRTELREVEAEGTEKAYVTEPIPPPLQEMITAFDEYIAMVPLEQEPNQDKPNQDRFAYLAGEIPFFYGQFPQAKARLYPIYQMQCGKTEYGYLAWEKLITMANKDNDVDESRQLALASKKQSCAVTEAQEVAQKGIADPTIQRGYFQEAAKAYERAQNMSEGPERKKAWRKAAELYEGALKEAPERDEAPEAAILGASAYKQIGEYDKAISMYNLFIDSYGDEKNLALLRDGDLNEGTPPQKKKYDERVKYLKVAYDALAEAYVLFFDYRQAAKTFDTIAGNPHFKAEDKRTAAQNAVFLYANIGDRDKVDTAKRRFFAMNPSAEEKAEIEWRIAHADVKQWDAKGPNKGTNAAARKKAASSVEGFYRKYNRDRAADPFTVQAAYWAAKLAAAGRNERGRADWCKKTIASFDQFKSGAGKEDGKSKANGTLQADMAAECHYARLDEVIAKEHDYESGHHRFKGVAADIISGPYKDCVETEAKKYFDQLQEVIDKYVSRKWAVAARARQGSLYDSCRTGLYNAREPDLQLYSDKEKRLIKQLDDLCVNQGSDKACEQYDTFTAKRRTDWFTARDKQLNSTDQAMVRGYVDAIIWGRAWKVRVPATDFAIRRLAFFTEIIGDAKLRQHSQGIKDPATKEEFVYQDGMFRRMRRGMVKDVDPNVLPSPLPAIPQP